jgi:hypothetical protein
MKDVGIPLEESLTWLTAVMLLVVVVQVALAISERLG